MEMLGKSGGEDYKYGFDPLNKGDVQVSTFYSSSLYGKVDAAAESSECRFRARRRDRGCRRRRCCRDRSRTPLPRLATDLPGNFCRSPFAAETRCPIFYRSFTTTAPDAGSMNPVRVRRVVVFPQPEGPRKVKNSPSPRPGGGPDPLRPDCRVQQGCHRADRHPQRGL